MIPYDWVLYYFGILVVLLFLPMIALRKSSPDRQCAVMLGIFIAGVYTLPALGLMVLMAVRGDLFQWGTIFMASWAGAATVGTLFFVRDMWRRNR